MIRQMRPIIAAHLIGNALALWLGYYWLGIGESRASTLLWSFAVALFTACLFCALHGAGFVWGNQSWLQPHISVVFRISLRNLPPLLAAAILATLIYAALTQWSTYSHNPAFTIASFLTQKLRKPIKPAAILRIFNTVLWLVRWVLVPVLIAPAISAIATGGWRGFAAIKDRRTWRYWLQTPLLLLIALWLPFQLLAWKPFMSSFSLEFISLVMRALFAYLLFVAGLLTLELLPAQRSQSPFPQAPT